jgi:hypothetical protein
MLWMGGFSAIHLGENGTTDAPDVIAVAPSGQVVVVECTTGGLRTDGKLQKLVDRTLEIRQQLADSNLGYLRVLPVMVTTRPREEVEQDLPDFERRGILVASQEDLRTSLDETLALQDGDQVFQRLENLAKDRQNSRRS